MNANPTPTDNDSRIKSLVQRFGSDDPFDRMDARHELVGLGDEAVDEIVAAFKDSRQQVRWEAAYCLREMGSRKAIPALIQELEDEKSDVGWLAAEALIAAGENSLIPVLKSLASSKHRDIYEFYNLAHHIIRTFSSRKKYQSVLQPLLNAFDQSEPQIGVPVESHAALQSLRA